MSIQREVSYLQSTIEARGSAFRSGFGTEGVLGGRFMGSDK